MSPIKISFKNLGAALVVVSALSHSCTEEKQPDATPDTGSITKLWQEENRDFLINGLKRTKTELINEIKDLGEAQWNFKENEWRWSISEIVEHLEVQDELYFREIFLTTKTPQSMKYIEVVKGKDEEFLKYSTDTIPGKTSWYLEPIGKFCSKDKSEEAFLRTRDNLIRFVKDTDLDLRRFFTFRKYVDDGGLSEVRLWDLRDLHQLLLTTIAHTDRHLIQMRKVKLHPDYPQE